MSQIITIPAREVVAGMLLDDDIVEHVEACLHHGHPAIEIHHGPGGGLYGPDELLPVTLPGPSPCELLCSCHRLTGNWSALGAWASTETPPERHKPDCPVRRLRLRVWPAPVHKDAWQWDDGKWGTIWTDGDSWWVSPQEVLQACQRADSERKSQVKQAFCLPDEPLQGESNAMALLAAADEYRAWRHANGIPDLNAAQIDALLGDDEP